jgi:hypothetical protein
MNAHSFAMTNFFVAMGFTLMNQIGIFGTTVSNNAGIFNTFIEKLTTPIVTVAGFPVTGILAIASGFALTTIVVLNSNLTGVSAQGASMVVYCFIFFGSLFVIGMDIFEVLAVSSPIQSIMTTLYGAYSLVGTLAFLYMLVQMSSGGQKMMD